ncbi:MAG TPA: hypothetical protein VF335_05710 [Chitinivibrionales bacterium]
MYNPNDPQSIEKYSSASTLSDMEIFIFPELLFSLVLANIMSPRLWAWKNDSWFSDFSKLTPYRRVLRLKQYIMDHFSFNLDLDTWGLTTKQQELGRFSAFIDENALSQSNALFGYEGDKYYFDIDIRKHFGLDKYTSDIIPYWKTETIEAMEAFRHKPGYSSGAGECVSLSTLYGAALFAVARIPIDDIFLLATPLHSQNFIDINDGVLTNNRRIVTKNMWFNGTELSEKARRALQHERITVVAHHTGYIHTLYPHATIAPSAYDRFCDKLEKFLTTDITFEILSNFIRQNSRYQKCFQITHACCGKPRYIEAEKVYSYEHNSTFKVGDATRAKLLHEIDEDEFYPQPVEGRLVLDEVEKFFLGKPVSLDSASVIDELKKHLDHCCFNVEKIMQELIAFCRIKPNLPGVGKQWSAPKALPLDGLTSSNDTIELLQTLRADNPVVDLAFAAYRDMSRTPWKPFVKAALERNPVCIAGFGNAPMADVARKLDALDNESIYDGKRMAQPDEVWNYGRGDGLEKALCLIDVIKNKRPHDTVSLQGDGKKVVVKFGNEEYAFTSGKGLELPVQNDFDS